MHFYVNLQTISNLEAQVSTLHDEFQQAHEQHKQKLAEMALLQEEERQKAIHAKEASMQQLRSDMERMTNDLKKSHQQEMDANLEKVNRGRDMAEFCCSGVEEKLSIFIYFFLIQNEVSRICAQPHQSAAAAGTWDINSFNPKWLPSLPHSM